MLVQIFLTERAHLVIMCNILYHDTYKYFDDKSFCGAGLFCTCRSLKRDNFDRVAELGRAVLSWPRSRAWPRSTFLAA